MRVPVAFEMTREVLPGRFDGNAARLWPELDISSARQDFIMGHFSGKDFARCRSFVDASTHLALGLAEC